MFLILYLSDNYFEINPRLGKEVCKFTVGFQNFKNKQSASNQAKKKKKLY